MRAKSTHWQEHSQILKLAITEDNPIIKKDYSQAKERGVRPFDGR